MSKGIAAGNRLSFGGFLTDFGQLLGSLPTAPANGAASPMFQIDGIKTAPLAVGEDEAVQVTGDDVLLGEFNFESLTVRQYIIEYAVDDIDRDAVLTGVNKDTFAGVETIPFDINSKPEYNLSLIHQSRAKRYAGGAKAWEGVIVNMATMNPLGRNGFNERGAASYRASVSPQLAQYKPGAVTYSQLVDGTLAARYVRFQSENPIHRVAFVGDGSATAIPLPFTPASAALVAFFANRVLLGAAASITANSATPPSSIPLGVLGEVFYQFIP